MAADGVGREVEFPHPAAERSRTPVRRPEFRERISGRYVLYAFTALIYVFLFLPILVVAITSINPAGVATFPVTGVTGEWYRDLIDDNRMLTALQRSLLIALIAATVTSALGLIAAYGLSHYAFRFKQAAQALFFLPMLVPGVVIGISLIIWFNRIGISTGFLTIVIAHIVMALPFAITIILTSFYGFDHRLEEASQDLGANEWRTFKNVTLPLVLPGVIGGALIAFTISFDEFVVTFFVAGGGVVTLPIEIFSRIRFSLSPVINAVATLVLVFSILLVAAGQLMATRRGGTD